MLLAGGPDHNQTHLAVAQLHGGNARAQMAPWAKYDGPMSVFILSS